MEYGRKKRTGKVGSWSEEGRKKGGGRRKKEEEGEGRKIEKGGDRRRKEKGRKWKVGGRGEEK